MASTALSGTARSSFNPERSVQGWASPSDSPALQYPYGDPESSYRPASLSAPFSSRSWSTPDTAPSRARTVRFASQRLTQNYSPPGSITRPESDLSSAATSPVPQLVSEGRTGAPGAEGGLAKQFSIAGQKLRLASSVYPEQTRSPYSGVTLDAARSRSASPSARHRGISSISQAGSGPASSRTSGGATGTSDTTLKRTTTLPGSREDNMSSFSTIAQSAPVALGSRDQGFSDSSGDQEAARFSRSAPRTFFDSCARDVKTPPGASYAGEAARVCGQAGAGFTTSPGDFLGAGQLPVPSQSVMRHTDARGGQFESGGPGDLQERQAQLQMELKALQGRQQQLLSQQARQLYHQKMQRPWLVPCKVSPDSARVATLTILPSKENGKSGSSERSGSCPIFSRCGRSARSRSNSTRARRIGVYVRPSDTANVQPVATAPGMSPETRQPAFYPSWSWGGAAFPQCMGPADLSWDDGTRSGNAACPLVLKVDVVPSQPEKPPEEKAEEWKKSLSLGVSSSAVSASEAAEPDPRMEQILKENDALRQDNASLKAQLEQAHAEGVGRRLAAIDAARRAQVDLYGEDSVMWEQELDNQKLRRQIAELGAALYAATEDGDFRLATEALTQQLTDAHHEISVLKKMMRSEANAAARHSSFLNALGCRDTSDAATLGANDISVREAAVDSLLSQGKRVTTQGREKVWGALSSMKDLVDQVFDRMTRLLTSTCTMEEKVKYLEGLQVLVVSSLDGTLDAYEELAATCSKFDQIRAVVFDPKRNSPYCPCRPRRQVLEDDLKHLCLQNKDAAEKLRQLRARIVKLEMENLRFYVKHPEEPGMQPEAPPVSRAVASQGVKARGALCRLQSPVKRDSPHRNDSAVAEATRDDSDTSEESVSVTRKPVETHRKAPFETNRKTKLLRNRQEVFPDRDEVTPHQFTTMIKKLQDEIDRLKDERQFDRTRDAEREQYLTYRVFNKNHILQDKLNEQDRLLARLMQMIEDRDRMSAAASAVTPTQRAQCRALHEDIEESRTLIRQSSAALREGQAPAPQVFENLLTRLRSLKPGSLNDMTAEEQELLEMINRQAYQLRKIHEAVTELTDNP
uniref:Uncharacterized protein n=1 Tax=Neospora caninum (strain Liverpool) TaxID=572307 RepID=A0A0F7UJX3_NEOCL|nr:TPA: hypothetical protein BN1204_046010 [Neospora caninum Liverpool]